MNTFFRVAIFFSIAMIVFNMVIGFVGSLENPAGDKVFPMRDTPGAVSADEESILSEVTGLEEPNMEALWIGIVGGGMAVALFLSWISHTLTPLGIHLFSTIFWTAWIKSNSILSGGFIPQEFLNIFFVGMIFLFIAAVIGMITGSG